MLRDDVISHGSHLIDLSTASGGGSASAILAEVCKEIPSPVANAFYWNLDGDSGCDPQDTQTGHSQGSPRSPT